MDLTDGQRFLTQTYGAEALADWVRQKFGVKVPIEEIADKSGDGPERVPVSQGARRVPPEGRRVPGPGRRCRTSWPRSRTAGGQRYDRDGLYRWAAQRLGTVLAARKHGAGDGAAPNAGPGFFDAAFKAIDAEGLTEEFLRTEPRSKLREKLHGDRAEGDARRPTSTRSTRSSTTCSAGRRWPKAEDAKELADWAKTELGLTLDAAKLTGKTPDDARHTLLNAYDQKYRAGDALGRAEPGAGATRQRLEDAPAGDGQPAERRRPAPVTPRKTRRSSTSARA